MLKPCDKLAQVAAFNIKWKPGNEPTTNLYA